LNAALSSRGLPALTEPLTAGQLLRRPEISIADVYAIAPPPGHVPFEVAEQVEIRVKYEGYINRQERDIERMRHFEGAPIPEWLDYAAVPGLPRECKDRLNQVRPVTFGQAARISGVRPADIAVLHIYAEKLARQRAANGDLQP
jgi:tRNA uridine 5-carboxymethylaminomethyl modification enzyme